MSNTEITLDSFANRCNSARMCIQDLQEDHLAQAILVVGAEGIGKKTLIRLLGKALLCKGDPKPCGQCRSCKRFDSGSHPNLICPKPDTKSKTVSIDIIRKNVLDPVSRHPLEMGKRVVLLEDADRMIAPPAQNALLKTIEEPDPSTYFLFSANQETAILPTIRSRCSIVRLEPMADQQVRSLLIHAGADEQKAADIASLSEGSPGRALAMLTDPAFVDREKLIFDSFFSLNSPSGVISAANLLKDSKDDADEILTLLTQEVQLCLQETTGLRDKSKEFPELWRTAPASGLAHVLTFVLDAQKMRPANVSWKAILDQLLENIAEEITTWQR